MIKIKNTHGQAVGYLNNLPFILYNLNWNLIQINLTIFFIII